MNVYCFFHNNIISLKIFIMILNLILEAANYCLEANSSRQCRLKNMNKIFLKMKDSIRKIENKKHKKIMPEESEPQVNQELNPEESDSKVDESDGESE